MRKIVIKKGEKNIEMPNDGIYVNGFIIKASISKSKLDVIQYNSSNKQRPKRIQGD